MKIHQLVEGLLDFPDEDTIAICDLLGYPHAPSVQRPPHNDWASFPQETTVLLVARDAPPPEQAISKRDQSLTLATFQAVATALAVYPHHGQGDLTDITIALAGIVGEAGKALHSWHKPLRGEGEITANARMVLAEHLGDILWYAAALAKALDTPLTQIAVAGLRKARSRKRMTETKQAQGNWFDPC